MNLHLLIQYLRISVLLSKEIVFEAKASQSQAFSLPSVYPSIHPPGCRHAILSCCVPHPVTLTSSNLLKEDEDEDKFEELYK